MSDRIIEAFKLLKINERDYPNYYDPYSFAEKFEICSLYNETDITTSDSTYKSNCFSAKCLDKVSENKDK